MEGELGPRRQRLLPVRRQELCWMEMMGIRWSKQWAVRTALHHLWNRVLPWRRTMLAAEKIQQSCMKVPRPSFQHTAGTDSPSSLCSTPLSAPLITTLRKLDLIYSLGAGLWKGDAIMLLWCVCSEKMDMKNPLFYYLCVYLFGYKGLVVGACRVYVGIQTQGLQHRASSLTGTRALRWGLTELATGPSGGSLGKSLIEEDWYFLYLIKVIISFKHELKNHIELLNCWLWYLNLTYIAYF